MMPVSPRHLLYVQVGKKIANRFSFSLHHTSLVQQLLVKRAHRRIRHNPVALRARSHWYGDGFRRRRVVAATRLRERHPVGARLRDEVRTSEMRTVTRMPSASATSAKPHPLAMNLTIANGSTPAPRCPCLTSTSATSVCTFRLPPLRSRTRERDPNAPDYAPHPDGVHPQPPPGLCIQRHPSTDTTPPISPHIVCHQPRSAAAVGWRAPRRARSLR